MFNLSVWGCRTNDFRFFSQANAKTMPNVAGRVPASSPFGFIQFARPTDVKTPLPTTGTPARSTNVTTHLRDLHTSPNRVVAPSQGYPNGKSLNFAKRKVAKFQRLSQRSRLLQVEIRLLRVNAHGARPVHLIITMIKRTRTSRLSSEKSLSRAGGNPAAARQRRVGNPTPQTLNPKP